MLPFVNLLACWVSSPTSPFKTWQMSKVNSSKQMRSLTKSKSSRPEQHSWNCEHYNMDSTYSSRQITIEDDKGWLWEDRPSIQQRLFPPKSLKHRHWRPSNCHSCQSQPYFQSRRANRILEHHFKNSPPLTLTDSAPPTTVGVRTSSNTSPLSFSF